MVERLDMALQHYSSVVGEESSYVAGAGAAGGVGYGVMALLGAKPQSGIELVLNTIDFKNIIDGSDLVVTGEGRIDNQTLMGKAPAGVLRYAKEQNIPCVAVGGSVKWSDELRQSGFKKIYAATPHDMPLEEAMCRDTAYRNLRSTAMRIAMEWPTL
jgi:glycerate kinase